MINYTNNEVTPSILEKFNNKDQEIFGSIYSLLYNDFYRYALHLNEGNEEEAQDVIHDVFMKIWSDNKISFDSLPQLKAFVFISIKNSFINNLNHNKIKREYYSKDIELENEEYDYEYDLLRSEIYSQIDKALATLPSECSGVIKLYIEGFKPSEIAVKLNKSIQTVYNMKQIAINTLKKKISDYKILSIIMGI